MPDTADASVDLVGVLLGHHVPATDAAWRGVLRAAEQHSVLEGLSARVRAESLDVPDGVREVLDGARAEAAIRADLALRTAALVCGAASDATVVKGVALVAWGAVAAGDRYFADVDILVPRARAEAATRALRDAGYSVREMVRHDGRVRSPSEWPGATWTSPEGAIVDLHVVVRPLPEAVWVTTGQGRVRIAAPAALVSGLCRHVEAHHRGTRRGALRHALDLRAVRAFVPADLWQAFAREPSVARSIEALRELEHAAVTRDAATIAHAIGEPAITPMRRHVERALQRFVSIARHEPGQIPWLFFPHPRYVREMSGARDTSELVRAYAVRWLGLTPTLSPRPGRGGRKAS